MAELNEVFDSGMPTAAEMCPPRDPAQPPAYPRMIFKDFSIETILRGFVMGGPRSAALFTDEGATVFHGHNLKGDTAGSTMGALVKLFDSGSGERLRQTDQEGSGSFFGASFTCSISCQPVVAREALSNDLLMGQGLMARFLLACPMPRAGSRSESKESLERNPYKDPALNRYWERIRKLMFNAPRFDAHGALVRDVLPVDDDALELWLQIYNEYEKKQARGEEYSGRVKPFAGRLGEQVCRVATVLAAFEGLASVDRQTMANAVRIVAYSLGQWKATIEASAVSKATANAAELLKWLQKHPEHRTLTSVYQKGPKPCRSKDSALRNLNTLVDADWLRTSDHFKSFRVYGDGDAV